MKKLIIALLGTLLCLRCCAPVDRISLEVSFQKAVSYKLALYEFDEFLTALSIPESGDIKTYPKRGVVSPYHLVNKTTGASGRWQLTAIARKDIGYKGSQKQFLSSEKTQNECIVKLLKKNSFYIKRYIPDYRKYIGTTVHGVKITWTAMLVASHFAGVGGLKHFLNTGHNATDGNKTIKDYMNMFNNYQIGLIIA
jgi:hypothetical protein